MQRVVIRNPLSGEEHTVEIQYLIKQEKYIRTLRWRNKTEWKIGDLVLFQPKDYKTAGQNSSNFIFTIITDIIGNKADLRAIWTRAKDDKKNTVWKGVSESQLYHPNPIYRDYDDYQHYRKSVLEGRLPPLFTFETRDYDDKFAGLTVAEPIQKEDSIQFDAKGTLTSQDQMEREIFRAIEKKMTANPDFKKAVVEREASLQQLGIQTDKSRTVKEFGAHVLDEVPYRTAMHHVLYDKERIKYDFEQLQQKINQNPEYESNLTEDEVRLLQNGKQLNQRYEELRGQALVEQHKTAVKMLPKGATISEIGRKAEQLLDAPLQSDTNMLMLVGVGLAAAAAFFYLRK